MFGLTSLFNNEEEDDCDSDDYDGEEDLVFDEDMEQVFQYSEEFDLPSHHKCASHTLNLVSTTDIGNFAKNSKKFSTIFHVSIGKCAGLWNLLKRSANKANEIAFNILGKCLKTPCATRWNTFYDSLEDLLRFEDVKLNKILSELKLPLLTDNQRDFLIEYVSCLKPIAVTLDKLQGETNVAMGDVIPYILNLEHNLKNLKRLN